MMDNLFGPMGSLFDLDGDGKLDAGETGFGFMVLDDIFSEDDDSDEEDDLFDDDD